MKKKYWITRDKRKSSLPEINSILLWDYKRKPQKKINKDTNDIFYFLNNVKDYEEYKKSHLYFSVSNFKELFNFTKNVLRKLYGFSIEMN